MLGFERHRSREKSGLATFDWQVGGADDGLACHLMFCHEGWHRYHFSASLSMLECMTAHDERHPQEGGLAPLNFVLAANKISWSAAEESATPRGATVMCLGWLVAKSSGAVSLRL